MWRSGHDIRSVAELLVNQSPGTMNTRNLNPPGYDVSRTHSINLITDEFLSGYMHDGRMSVVRRFFCLFVGFDLFLVSLLWIICIMINGDSIFDAFEKQVVHYTFASSLFDVVIVAICRFTLLMIFYALLYLNHWYVIALSTSSSCVFLISKIFLFNWISSKQQVFEVVLIIISAILAWGEAWFLDCRVLPQERHARHYFSSIEAQHSDRSPLVAPLLVSQTESHPAESAANFYSPLDTAHHSGDEDDLLDDEYHQMALDCIKKAYELLKSPDWKVERVTKKGDTIYSLHREKLGKIFKLTGSLKYSPKALCENLFYQIEKQPTWNPNMLECKILRVFKHVYISEKHKYEKIDMFLQKINSYTDIIYQATMGGSGGFIKRDFVNLRCWRIFQNDRICNDSCYDEDSNLDNGNVRNSVEGSVSTVSDSDTNCNTPIQSTTGSCIDRTSLQTRANNEAFQTLSKSLGAKDFVSNLPPVVSCATNEIPPLDEEFIDAKENLDDEPDANVVYKAHKKGRVWVSAAISVDYNKVPISTKYTRGQNLVAGFAMHEIEGKQNACIFEWILCLDLKGYIPRNILDMAYTALMSDYMTYLRKHIKELRQ